MRDLARELLAEEEQLFAEALSAPGAVDERIARLVDAVVERFAAWAHYGRPLLEIWAQDSRRLKPLLRTLRQSLASVIKEGQKKGDIARDLEPKETATLLVGLIDGLMLQVFIDPAGVPPSNAMRRTLAMTLRRILSADVPHDFRPLLMGKGPTLSHAEARRFYDRFGAWQDSQEFYERRALDRLLLQLRLGDARALVEFGCGTGRLAARLLSEHLPPECRYLGLDLSHTMVALARTRVATFGQRAEIRQTDGSPRIVCTSQAFDRFVSAYVLDLLPEDEIQALLAEARRILVPDGLVGIVSLTHGEQTAERAVSWIWKRVHVLRPALLGGCRPIDVAFALREGGFKILHRCVVSRFAIPSEVVIAEKA